jgi:hypothetical protein
VNNRFFTSLTLSTAALLMSCLTTPLSANTFRWVDENGQVHYSDHIPPQDVNKAYSIINKQGVTINSVEQAKTKEQLEEEQRIQQQKAEQERLARERSTYDHILMDTYTKVSDLEETRDRYIATLEGLIKVAEHKLTSLNHDLDNINKAAANLEREGKAMPEDMRQDIANLQTQIERENNFILAQRAQQKVMREKFAADIQRFQELKAQQQSKK